MKYRVEINNLTDRCRVFEIEAESEDDAIERCWQQDPDAKLISDDEKDIDSSEYCKEIPNG